jgi:hypothetical protein
MTLPLPVRGDAVEFAGIQYVLNFDFGIQLYEKVVNYVDSHGIDKNWFEHIQASYELKKLPRYDDPKDPRFLQGGCVPWLSNSTSLSRTCGAH